MTVVFFVFDVVIVVDVTAAVFVMRVFAVTELIAKPSEKQKLTYIVPKSHIKGFYANLVNLFDSAIFRHRKFREGEGSEPYSGAERSDCK